MAVPTWTLTFGANTVTNVQDVTVSIGRTKITDQFRSGNATISGRRPDLLPSIKIGDSFTISLTWGALSGSYLMRVADLKVVYGITSAQDTWTIEGEDSFAVLGRALVSPSWAAGTSTYDAFAAVCTAAGVTPDLNPAKPAQSTVKAFTGTNVNALDLVNTIANTEQAYLAGSSTFVQFSGRNWQAGAIYYDVSDDGTGTTPSVYDRLTFTTLADNYSTKVEVQIRDGVAVTSGTGNYSYSLDTYSNSTPDAQNVAEFLYSQLNVGTAVPTSFSIMLNRQTNNNWLGLSVPQGVNLKFRGTTYKCFIVGQTLSGDPSQTRATYHVVSAEFYKYLVLNDTTFGTLNYNKLGF